MRTQLFNHLQSLSPAFFHRTSVGRIMSRSQSDVLQLQETFELLVTTLADILSLAGIIVAMLVTNWQLALISLSIIPPLFFVLAYWQRFARHSFMRIRRAIAMVNGDGANAGARRSSPRRTAWISALGLLEPIQPALTPW
jgi:ATP-binding cassette subfamily B protein